MTAELTAAPIISPINWSNGRNFMLNPDLKSLRISPASPHATATMQAIKNNERSVMFVENDYILRQIKQVIRNLAGLLNLQTVFDLLSDTIDVQDEATVLKVTNAYYAELIRIKLQSKDSEYMERLSHNSGLPLHALNKLISGEEMLDKEQVELLKAYFGD